MSLAARHAAAAATQAWLDEHHPVVVVEDAGHAVAFAAAHPYSSRPFYSGSAGVSVYVDRRFRGMGPAASPSKH